MFWFYSCCSRCLKVCVEVFMWCFRWWLLLISSNCVECVCV